MDTVWVPDLEVTRRQLPDVLHLRVAGVLDAATREAMRAYLLAAIDEQIGYREADSRPRGSPASAPVGRTIVVDLAGVDFIDSEGLGVLIGAFKHALDEGVRLCFVVGQPHVQKIFEITGLTQILEVYPSLDEAPYAGSSQNVERKTP
jgi:anti-anti-sigma regulatory factor